MRKEEYIYLDLHINMSTRVMADVLYAGIMTGTAFTILWTMTQEYNRKQNSRNGAMIKVHIHPDMIFDFEELSGHRLEKPQTVGIP